MGSHIEVELLAYLDGELEARERARVEAHLAACPHCVAELERLRALRQDLDATFDAALSTVRLPAAADRRIRDRIRAGTEPRWWWGLWRRRGWVAQALLAVLVLVFAINTGQALRIPQSAAPPPSPQETLVLGQDRLAPGSRAALRVIVRSAGEDAAGSEPVAGARVVVRIGRTPGLASVVYTGRTDAGGTAQVDFTVPEDLEGPSSLIVETSSAAGEDRIVRPITVARDYKLLLSSDKPAYRPGQTIHTRSLALDALDRRPAAGQEIEFSVFDPVGQRLEHSLVPASDFGVAGLDFVLPADATYGQYTLRAALGDTVSERTVEVGAYDLPAFRVALDTDRAFYHPGGRVTGSVRAEYFFGKPVAGGRVLLRGYVRDPERVQVLQLTGQTDDEGCFEFAFDLPPLTDLAATPEEVLHFDLEAEVVDLAGQREGIRLPLPVAGQPILINAIPESGRLKPDVENVIFILTSYPDGRPVETTMTIRVAGREHRLATGPYGLAEFRYVPTAPVTRLDVRAEDGKGGKGSDVFTFESERAPYTLLLRAERATYQVGETLRAEALVAGEGDAASQIVYLDVVRAGQTIAVLSAPVEAGRAVFALDLDGTLVGTLSLRAYRILPDGSKVGDARLVVVDAPRQVTVAVTADRDEYRPGDTAHLQFQTTVTSTGQAGKRPVQSVLGIGVVDESVYALEEQTPGFVRTYFLLERELLERRGRVQALDVAALLDAESEVKAAQDVAARAAWAGAPVPDFTLSARSVAEKREVEPRADVAARTAVSNRIGVWLALLPLLLCGVVGRGLRSAGVLRRALRRVGVGFLALLLASPVVLLFAGGGMWLLWIVLGVGAPVVVLLVVVALLAGLMVHGWWWSDARVQLATGLLAAYLALGGLLIVLAARGGELSDAVLALLAVTFLLLVAALAALGQGLVVEGWGGAGWATTSLGLLLVILVIYLPFVPGLASDLTRVLGHPALYAGPVGWLTGCGPAAPEIATVEVTRIVEKEGEAVVEEVVVTATPGPAPTGEATEPAAASPTPAPTATAMSVSDEPLPVRQIFPETLYWNAEALTAEDGTLALDLPLADNVTTWRLTALASTQNGELGVTTWDVVVFQDFFVDLDVPAVINRGEEITVTVTLYNYLPQAQEVRIEPAPDDWYTLLPPSAIPYTLTLPPNDVSTVQFFVRAERAGRFSLRVEAQGERMSDAVARDVTVEP